MICACCREPTSRKRVASPVKPLILSYRVALVRIVSTSPPADHAFCSMDFRPVSVNAVAEPSVTGEVAKPDTGAVVVAPVWLTLMWLGA